MARRFIAPVRVAVGAALALAGLALLANPASAAVKSTTTTVTESSGARTGAPVTFTATVVHGALVPTGTVTFTVTGTSSTPYTCDSGNVSSLQPNGSGPGAVATCTFTAGLQASDSPYAVSASYSGDPNFSGSTGNLSATIHLGNTTTTLNSASNPSVTGQPVTFTATVNSNIGAPPDGETVTFIQGAITVGTGVLSGGTATFTTSALAVGTKPVKATYGGDAGFVNSTSAIVSQVIAKAASTVALTSSLNPSTFGQSVTLAATVSGQFGGTPTGVVVFKDGTTTLKTVTLSGATASFATTKLARGTHNITATYNGTISYTTGTTSLSQTVN
jgi:hypothetical protein